MFREGNLELVTVHKTKTKAEVANKGRAEKMEKVNGIILIELQMLDLKK